jgi:hypothetical protein
MRVSGNGIIIDPIWIKYNILFIFQMHLQLRLGRMFLS